MRPDPESRSILGYVPDRVQDAKANGTTGEDKPKTRTRPTTTRNRSQQKSKRFERQNGGETARPAQPAAAPAAPAAETGLSPRALLTRLEQQSGQLGILSSKLDDARQALERERESVQADRKALADERQARQRLEAMLKREQAARKQAEETLDESRATATALEAQHHLLRAQLTTLEHKTGRRRFGLRRGR